jgi:hypothetical protein
MGRRREMLRSARCGFGLLAATLLTALVVPVVADADALPDGRVYEQVSPTLKNGFDAGAPSGVPRYAVATADGSGLLYGTRGPMGTVHRGLQDYAVGRRTPDGWSSESALPGGSSDRIYAISYAPSELLPSSDLTKIVFGAFGSYVPDNPVTLNTSAALYIGHVDGTLDWLTRPQIANSVPAPGSIPNISLFQPIGAAPDLSTVYFTAAPSLLPDDAARAPFYNPSDPGSSPWGLYEYSGGTLKPAGTLPDGSEDPGGAAPASSGGTYRANSTFASPEVASNQVSRDGSTLFFVSPDPGPHPGAGSISGRPSQLYVRRNGRSTLVSHTPDRAAAVDGISSVPALTLNSDAVSGEYAYGSADGTSAIFYSGDALAPGAPSDSSQKAYRYDVATDTVSYLPGVAGTVVAASDDGQRFLFGDSQRILVWDHGTIKLIASAGSQQLSPARATASGSSFVFSTRASIAGFVTGGTVQIYRYDVAQDATTCLSCPPAGSAPSGDARLSNQDTLLSRPSGEMIPSRGLSEDGRRVFFDTSDALVARDTNAGKRDVYEWTPGGVSLISSGRSQDDSFFLDNSADGDDVFFATAEGLAAGDTDGAYDVYDARVDGGFKKADQAAPCVGDACQGAASGAPSLQAPGSAAFSGPENQEAPTSTGKPTPTAKLKLGSHKLVERTLALTVTIARPGRVTVAGRGLRSVTRTYAGTGTFKIVVPLTATAKRSLTRKHRLRLSVRVGFTPQFGAASSVKFVLDAKA